MLYSKAEHLEKFPAYKVRPASNIIPDRWETGTQNHEGLAGLVGVIDYLAALGREYSAQYNNAFEALSGGSSYRARHLHLNIALQAIMAYEDDLSAQLLAGFREIKDITIYA